MFRKNIVDVVEFKLEVFIDSGDRLLYKVLFSGNFCLFLRVSNVVKIKWLDTNALVESFEKEYKILDLQAENCNHFKFLTITILLEFHEDLFNDSNQ